METDQDPVYREQLSLDISLQRGAFTLRVSADLPAVGITAVTGRSGSGKTSLLRAIAGLETSAKGLISLGKTTWMGQGGAVPPHQRGIGMVFQEPRLFPNLNVRENLMFGAKRAGLNLSDVGPVAEAFDLTPMMARKVQSLSGGEQRRVALARALSMKPRLLLLDEPLTGLDAERKAEVFPYLLKAVSQSNCPVLYVTHDQDEVIALADRRLRIADGQILGGLETIPDRYDMKVLNSRDGRVGLQAGNDTIFVQGTAQVGSMARLYMPAQTILVSLTKPPASNAVATLEGAVQGVADLSDGNLEVHVAVASHCVRAIVAQSSRVSGDLSAGQTVWLAPMQARLLPDRGI